MHSEELHRIYSSAKSGDPQARALLEVEVHQEAAGLLQSEPFRTYLKEDILVEVAMRCLLDSPKPPNNLQHSISSSAESCLLHALAQRTLSKDSRAAEVFYDRLKKLLQPVFRGWTQGDRHLVGVARLSDLVQTVYKRLLQASPPIPSTAGEYTRRWLLTVARNRLRDYHRKYETRRKHEARLRHEARLKQEGSEQPGQCTLDRLIEQEEKELIEQKKKDRMTPVVRAIYEERIVNDKSWREVGKLVGLTDRAACERWRRYLEQFGEE
jgi:RNA polymerase sigma factor (sigma-70 family)